MDLHLKNIIFPVIFIMLLNSCSTLVFISKTVPPQLVLEKKPARIIVINQHDYQSNVRIKDKHKNAYRIGIEQFCESLTNNNSPKATTVMFMYNMNDFETPISFDSVLIKNDINSLCAVNNADYLLSLDSLHLDFDWEVFKEENDDGSVSKTKDFYVYCKYYISLYDSIGEVTEKTLIEREHHFASRPTLGGLITFKPNLKNATKQIHKLAYDSGIEYHSLFYPTIEDVPRKLYVGKAFKETNFLIKSKQYDKAIRILQEMIEELNSKQASKAQHNLSVALELKEKTAVDFFFIDDIRLQSK
ncbi:DUF6340 family protein [Carboxylicivirga marina]|uniref:DUF6340 family protein n=1 Tax=Carboxylicivirga marina TaxID=2800988 RepID=UPI00259A758D|nr:DUF6340 family protein [uncultured Carboxylicivirga sp.]